MAVIPLLKVALFIGAIVSLKICINVPLSVDWAPNWPGVCIIRAL